MILQKIDLYVHYGVERKDENGGYLTVCSRTESNEVKRRTRPAVLVMPGGAYAYLSDREGEPIALKFVDKGFAAFILHYSVREKYPAPLLEAEMAVAFIRDNAQTYHVDKDCVCAVGFSAGGHLTGLLATVKQDESALDRPIDCLRPNFVVLSYPVISTGKYGHVETRDNITGSGQIPSEMLSVENRADRHSAPAFIWHTLQDEAVPVENSLLLAKAYKKHGVPFALHIFERGWHGLSLADDETDDFSPDNAYLYDVGKWFDLACDWLAMHGCRVKRA